MLIDAFMFFQEFEILEMRLALLDPQVDRFVIVEADATHSGRRRDYAFPAYFERHLRSYAAKIVYHPVRIDLEQYDTGRRPESYDLGTDHWKIENLQRNAMDEACRAFPEDDLLMISDVDEIPRREAIDFLLRDCARVAAGPVAFQQFFFYYTLRRVRREDWRGTVMTTVGRSRARSAQWHRNNASTLPFLAQAGWHLSYFGGTQRIQTKLESFAHQELNHPGFKSASHIETAAGAGTDLFGRGVESDAVGRDFFPDYFLALADRDPGFFFP